MRFSIRGIAWIFCLLSFIVFLGNVGGCTPFYKAIGLSDSQATTQAAADTKAVTTFVENTRETFWPIANAAIAGLATVISAYLGITLKKEKKINTAIISGVEMTGEKSVKDAVFLASTLAGNAKDVNTRVQNVTGNATLPVNKKPST